MRSPVDGHQALPHTDRSALRLVLCEQAFLQAGVLSHETIDLQQHKAGMVFVFEQLADVPIPENEWFEQVFMNFDTDCTGRIDFDKFVEIVTQWDDFCQDRRVRMADLTAAANAVAANGLGPRGTLVASSSWASRPPGSKPRQVVAAWQMPTWGDDDFFDDEEPATPPLDSLAALAEEQGEAEDPQDADPKQRRRRWLPGSGRWQPKQRQKERSRSPAERTGDTSKDKEKDKENKDDKQ